MTASLAPIVAPFATFITVVLLSLSLFSPRTNEAKEKLKAYGYRAADDIDRLSRPFSERVAFPLLERLGRMLGSAAPVKMQERMRTALEQAGDPISMNTLLALRGVLALAAPAVYLALTATAQRRLGAPQLLFAVVLGLIGGYLPKIWLNHKVSARQRHIQRALPDALDLIVVSMEAGLALDGAIAKVVEKTKGPLKDELQRMLREIQLGKPRRDAFRQLGQRTNVAELIALVNSVVQADQMGVSMAQVMRTQADEARLKRRQRAEEKAHQAAVKMLVPLVLFILPSVMIVTVGPAALAIFKQFSSGGLFK
jgi:tight adherence protein C